MLTLLRVFALLLVTVTIGGVLVFLNLLGFRYVVRTENEPLNHPVRVVHYAWQELKLIDGRSVRFADPDIAPLVDSIRASGDVVEVEYIDDGAAKLYFKERIFVCGLGNPFFTIPVIPTEIRKYRRKFVEIVELKAVPSATESR